MDTSIRSTSRRASRRGPLVFWLVLSLWLAVAGGARAQQDIDPPGRVASLSGRAGGVVFAPAGEDEWVDAPVNRPLTRGDRLWTDRGARAELHLGTASLHLAGETHLGVTALDDNAAQFVLLQGGLNARVRELDRDENFEINTPNLAVRAARAGDYRVDVSPDGQVTRVTVRNGEALVYGAAGQQLRLYTGQQAAFGGRDLAQVRDPFGGPDALDAWASERNRLEDQSISARYVPRSVIGYSQLDAYGNWGQDPGYGAVWYPNVSQPNWAPYRYGHWAWIAPWGWTWVDDAPWGFAPFHYGRWALIGSRWAWVPGSFAARPTYAPALVVFIGGDSGSASFTVGSGPGIGWYPLGPGEAWRPAYRTSPRYWQYVNPSVREGRDREHLFRLQGGATTSVRADDFRPGRRVHEHWRPVAPAIAAQAPVFGGPRQPDRTRFEGVAPLPRLVAPAPPAALPGGSGWTGEGLSPRAREAARRDLQRREDDAQREQDRRNWEQDRAGRLPQRIAPERPFVPPPAAIGPAPQAPRAATIGPAPQFVPPPAQVGPAPQPAPAARLPAQAAPAPRAPAQVGPTPPPAQQAAPIGRVPPPAARAEPNRVERSAREKELQERRGNSGWTPGASGPADRP